MAVNLETLFSIFGQREFFQVKDSEDHWHYVHPDHLTEAQILWLLSEATGSQPEIKGLNGDRHHRTWCKPDRPGRNCRS